MKLLTKEIEKALPALYSTENQPEKLCVVKFFHPLSSWTWYGIEYSPEDRLFFGFVVGFDAELGYFSLDELESCVVHGLGIERDLYFKPTPLSTIRAMHE